MDFSIDTGISILPSNLSITIRKTAGGNNKILISSIDMKISSNRNINKDEVYQKNLNCMSSCQINAAPEMH